MAIENFESTIHLFGRNEYGREHFKVEGFSPYLYIDKDVENLDWKNDHVPANIEFGDGFESLFGDELLKVKAEDPSQVPKLRNLFKDHYEADLNYVLRFLIDREIKSGFDEDLNPTEFRCDPKCLYLDIEVSQDELRTSGMDEIITVTIMTDDEEFTYYLSNSRIEVFDSEAEVFRDESEMLESVFERIADLDPDVLTAWNSEYDFKNLINRAEALDVDYKKLSPLRTVFERNDSVRIYGREVLDLMKGYDRIKPNDARSLSLEYITNKELDEEKIDLSNAKELWKKGDAEKLIKGNKQHVELLKDLDSSLGIIDFWWTLKNEVGCRLSDLFIGNSRICDILILRKAREKDVVLPSKDYSERFSFKGGYVKEPERGIFEDVSILDFSAMYPSIIRQYNISPETKNEDSLTGFSQEKMGIIPETITELQSLRDEYKEALKHSTIESERENYDNKQTAVKFSINSLFGYLGFRASRLTDKECASKITEFARKLLKFVIESAENEDIEILYADTDSVMIQGDPDEFLRKFENDWLQKFLSEYNLDDRGTIKLEKEEEFEKFLFDTKKRYIGLTKDGVWKYKGLGDRKTSIPKISGDVELEFLKRLVLSEDYRSFFKESIDRIQNDGCSWTDFARSVRARKSLDEYEGNVQHIRAMKWSNRNLGKNYSKGAKPFYANVSDENGYDTDVVAFDSPKDLPSDLVPDYNFYCSLLTRQLSDYFDLVREEPPRWTEKNQRELIEF